jgi:predicted Zn-dependent peptidase
MLSLAFSEKSLEVQKNVVSEEFKQRYLNQPYGDVWLKLRPLVYKEHPYRWATIGKELSHIVNAKIEDVKAFFNKYYNPANAIMVVAGAVTTDHVKELSEKWFAGIPSSPKPVRNLPVEPQQTKEQREVIHADVPLNAIYTVFHSTARNDPGYYEADLISDLLSRGNASRLHLNLVKSQKLFSEINAHSTGSTDPGLFIIEGKPVKGVSMEDAEAAIWTEIEKFKNELVPVDELTKVKNKIESTMVFSEMSLLDKAMNLAMFELLSNASELNKETSKYLAVSAEDIQKRAKSIFRKDNCTTLYYLAN